MKLIAVFLPLLSAIHAPNINATEYDYVNHSRSLITRGMQAVMTCNGEFSSHRDPKLVQQQELAYVWDKPGAASHADMSVNHQQKTATVGMKDTLPAMRAAYRDGVGCVILPPHHDFDSVDELPSLKLPKPKQDLSKIAWPDGDYMVASPLPEGIDKEALEAAADWVFDREQYGTTGQEISLSMLVVHKGKIILERYADGVDYTTKTRTWSTAKSIASTLIGILVDQGKLSLDGPVGLEWLPESKSPEQDPRNAITLRNLLHMSSGLRPTDNNNLEYANGSGLAYWAGTSSVEGALSRGMIQAPGRKWDYENYDTLLAVKAMKNALGSQQRYLEFPHKALLHKLGMRSTTLGVDRFGDFILSSQVYSNARDLARFRLLHLNNGQWNGEQIISPEWIEFMRTPAPSTENMGGLYGGHWWLVPEGRTDVPADAYSTAGNRGQFVIVLPSHDLVIVRRGLDYGKGRHAVDRWGIAREVLTAFPRD